MMDFLFDIQMFAANDVVNGTNGYTNADTGVVTPFSGVNDLSPGNKIFYDTALLENARDQHYFAQFGMKTPLPANRGQTIEWRKWNTLPKAMTPLQEGVTPVGQKMGQTVITQTIEQYGDFVSMTDKVQMHQIDDIVVGAMEELGAAAGNTQDALIRNELLTGTNVSYADSVSGGTKTEVNQRYNLTTDCKLTADTINKAATKMKKSKAQPINGKWVCLIHPSCTEDLRRDSDWVEAHKYAQPDEIYNGEIGELHGVRFIETDTVRVISPKSLYTESQRYLTVASYVSNNTTAATNGEKSLYVITVDETIPNAADLVGHYILLEDATGTDATERCKVVGTDASKLHLAAAPTHTPADGDYLLPGDAGMETQAGGVPVAVYCNILMGKDAYAIIDPAGGSMETFVKQLGSSGTADPLNQRSTVGYKFEAASKILYEERILRLECCSSYSGTDEDNA